MQATDAGPQYPENSTGNKFLGSQCSAGILAVHRISRAVVGQMSYIRIQEMLYTDIEFTLQFTVSIC